MKLYKMEIGGVEHVVQLTDEEAAADPRVNENQADGEPKFELVDNRAPSARGEKEDEMGRPLIESAAVENAQRVERRKARAASNKQSTGETK